MCEKCVFKGMLQNIKLNRFVCGTEHYRRYKIRSYPMYLGRVNIEIFVWDKESSVMDKEIRINIISDTRKV